MTGRLPNGSCAMVAMFETPLGAEEASDRLKAALDADNAGDLAFLRSCRRFLMRVNAKVRFQASGAPEAVMRPLVQQIDFAKVAGFDTK